MENLKVSKTRGLKAYLVLVVKHRTTQNVPEGTRTYQNEPIWCQNKTEQTKKLAKLIHLFVYLIAIVLNRSFWGWQVPQVSS